jgi:hypothetical protein
LLGWVWNDTDNCFATTFPYFKGLLSSPRHAKNDIRLVQWDFEPVENALV